uniref:Uncharacterized protein n=1 Tax=Salvator merianae TaxID=96440 RepID=A0A8D0BGG9_SALMN
MVLVPCRKNILRSNLFQDIKQVWKGPKRKLPPQMLCTIEKSDVPQFNVYVETEQLSFEVHSSPLFIFIFIFSSVTYLTCTLLTHLLHSKPEMSHYTFYFVDYAGVSIYQYGNALTKFWLFSLTTAAFLCQMIPAGLAFILSISPVAHCVIMLSYYQILFFLVSSCHIVGCAHQIFHTFLATCTLSYLEAIFLDCKNRQDIFFRRHWVSFSHPDLWLLFWLSRLALAYLNEDAFKAVSK